MEDVSPFVTHLARLVWLMVHEPENQDGQKEELRRSVAQVSGAAQAVSLHDTAAAVSSAASNGVMGEEVEVIGELAMRMASHSVRLIQFDQLVPAREIQEVARALANYPVPGDEGAAFDGVMVGLTLTGVTVSIGASGFVRRATPGPMPAYVGPVRTPSVSMMSVAGRAAPPVPNGRTAQVSRGSSESQAMMQGQLMRATPEGGVSSLLARLDEATRSPNASAVVDEVTRATEDLATQGGWPDVVAVLDRMIQHHERLHDGDAKRAFLMGARRLERTGHMQGVAAQLTRRKDLREPCMRILAHAGDIGADVLIDNLINSDDAGDRRAYLDALRQCPSAAASLNQLLSDDRWFVVRNAASLLGELGAVESDRRLSEHLSHREPRVRRAVAVALGKLGTSRALLALLQAINDPSPEIRVQVVHAIASARNARAVPWLIEALDHEQDPDVQAALLGALGHTPTEDGVARLQRAAEAGGLLVRKPVGLRLRAIDALAEAGTPAARHALGTLLTDRDRDVRKAAEQAVARQAIA